MSGIVSFHLTILTLVGFTVAGAVVYRQIRKWYPIFRGPLLYILGVVAVNWLFRFWSCWYRITHDMASPLNAGEWVTPSALILQFGLAMALVVGVGIDYAKARAIDGAAHVGGR